MESPVGTDGRPFVVVEVDVGSEPECVAFKCFTLLCQPCQLGGGGDVHLSGSEGVVACGLGGGGAVPNGVGNVVLTIRRLPLIRDIHRHYRIGRRSHRLDDKASGGIGAVVAFQGYSGGDGDGFQRFAAARRRA